MAEVTRRIGAVAKKPAAVTVSPSPLNGKGKGSSPYSSTSGKYIIGPEEGSIPITELEQAVCLYYGERKIGKTAVANTHAEAFSMMFEPGGKGIRGLKKREPKSWLEFKAWNRALIATSPPLYRTVVIDTIDIAYQRCFSYICKKHSINNPSEAEDFGQTWNEVYTEFEDEMMKILSSGRGLIMISHADDKQMQTRAGFRYNKVVPTMGKQARKFAAGLADIIAVFIYYGEKRYMTLQGSSDLEAGHRLEERFIAQNGKPVHSIPMGENRHQAYANLVRAFNNEQPTSGKPSEDFTLSNIPAKSRSKRG